MFILLKISGGALAVIVAVILIVLLIAAGAIKKFYPEKRNKPWKK